MLLRNLFVDEDNFVKELTKIEIDAGDGKLEEILVRFAKEGHKVDLWSFSDLIRMLQVALQLLIRLNERRSRSVIGDLLLSIDSEERRMAYSMTGGVLTLAQKEQIEKILRYTVRSDYRLTIMI